MRILRRDFNPINEGIAILGTSQMVRLMGKFWMRSENVEFPFYALNVVRVDSRARGEAFIYLPNQILLPMRPNFLRVAGNNRHG
jgi:hypothetical protein